MFNPNHVAMIKMLSIQMRVRIEKPESDFLTIIVLCFA